MNLLPDEPPAHPARAYGWRLVCLAWCLALLPVCAAGQTTVTTTDAMGHREQVVYPPGVRVARLMEHGRLVAARTWDGNDDVRVIVQFRDPPLRGPVAGKAAARLQAAHDRFRAAVAALEATPRARTQFHRAFTTALNGMALTTPRWLAERIERMPAVRRVVPDAVVQATDEAGNQVIGADRVRAELGLTGAGVVLAVIDSGIDYTHPDLGGGFGPGFRVVGGYDFVHDDPDPMDDFGHGTHVAGIAAGGGPGVPGVAPGVSLMAFKVLDAQGFGRASDIIAAIERALDPDQNPDTDDAVDVINLSLGAEGNPDDPVSEAVDNAVAAGVVCVVAAGNEGGYQSIGSPGTARGALTVGATDNDDRITPFSSRGPANTTFGLKPELVAPGLQVNAPWPGGGYARLSGTSMAAPHVAGAVALLLEGHPEWTPARLKGVLMHHARDIGEDVWTQGAGRLDVGAAARATAFVSPPQVHFGVVDATEAVWQRTETLSLTHTAATTQTFTLEAETGTPGLTATVSPATVTLAPDAVADLALTLTVDNALVPFNGFPPPSGGVLLATSAEDTLRIPFVFIKSHQLDFTFDVAPLLVAIFRPGTTATLAPAAGGSVLLSEGTYTVVALFQDDEAGRRTLVVREGVVVSGRTTLTLSPAEAVHTITFRPRGEAGQELAPEVDYDLFEQKSTGFSLLLLGDPLYHELRTNTLRDDFVFHHVVYDYDDPSGADYIVPFRMAGVTADAVRENDPAALRAFAFTYATETGTTALAFVDVQVQNDRTELGFFDPGAAWQRLAPPFTRRVFVAPLPEEGFGFPAMFQEIYDVGEGGQPDLSGKANLLYETATLEVTSGPVNVYRRFGGTPVDQIEGTVIPQAVGTAPPFWSGNVLQFVGDRIYMAPAPFFVNPGFDTRNAPVTWTLFENREGLEQTDQGTVDNNRISSLPGNILFAPGAHQLVWRFDGYRVDGLAGHVSARQVFDTRMQTREPPNLQRLEITSGGVVTDVLDPGADNRLLFEGQFDGLTVEGMTRKVGEAAWTVLPVTALPDRRFEAVLPGTLAPGYHALRITLKDGAGSRFEYTADPAFRWGVKDVGGNRPPGAFRLVAPADGAEVDPAVDSLRLAWAAALDPDPEDVLRYVVTVAGPGLDTTVTVRVDTTLALALAPVSDARYTWSVRATDGYAEVAAAGFSFHTPAFVTGVTPDAGVPDAFDLAQNYPNPFRERTTIVFVMPVPDEVDLRVYDVLGREVAVLARGRWPAGRHRVVWEAGALPAGVYLCRLRTDAFTATRRLVHLR